MIEVFNLIYNIMQYKQLTDSIFEKQFHIVLNHLSIMHEVGRFIRGEKFKNTSNF